MSKQILHVITGLNNNKRATPIISNQANREKNLAITTQLLSICNQSNTLLNDNNREFRGLNKSNQRKRQEKL